MSSLPYDVGAASGEISSQLAAVGVDLAAFEPLPRNAVNSNPPFGRRFYSPFEDSRFDVLDTIPLSTGDTALEMTYRGSSIDIEAVLCDLNSDGRRIQADLIALPSADRDEFVGFLLN